MKILTSLTIVIAMLTFGNVTNAQDQRREGERTERSLSDGSDAQRRGGDRNREARGSDPQDARRGGQGAERRGGGGQGRGRGQGGQGGGGGLFRLLDIDRDGQLSAKEIDGAIAVLAKLDVNKDGTLDVEELVFHFPHYQSGDGPHSALFLGNYKLMKFYEDDRLALFDIASDVSEQNDLSNEMSEKVGELDALLVRYLNDIDAQMAVPNPQYDPNTAPQAGQSGRGGRDNRADVVLQVLDVNRDGKLSEAELKSIPGALRARDANGDGAVTLEEVQKAGQRRKSGGN